MKIRCYTCSHAMTRPDGELDYYFDPMPHETGGQTICLSERQHSLIADQHQGGIYAEEVLENASKK
jgi:hypothetical protein